MKNSQVAVLCLVILLGAMIVAASNWLLVRDLRDGAAAKCADVDASRTLPLAASRTTAEKKLTVAMMPKSLGNAYFIACQKGAQEAAEELGIELLWQGPTEPDPAKQSQIVDTWITRGVDVIAVAVENRDAISSVLKKARAARHQSAHLGCRRQSRCPRLFRQPGHAAGDWLHADGSCGPHPGRQGRVCDHHRIAHGGEHDRVAEAHRGAAGQQVSGHQNGGPAPVRRSAGQSARTKPTPFSMPIRT